MENMKFADLLSRKYLKNDQNADKYEERIVTSVSELQKISD